MSKVLAPLGVALGAAVWFLLFVILGFGLGTSFIAGGAAAGTVVIAAARATATPVRSILDAPVSSTGVLIGLATFVILVAVLSVSTWIGVVAALATIGLHAIVDAALASTEIVVPSRHRFAHDRPASQSPAPARAAHNGHDRTAREPVGAR
jgi:hypothetical protein